MARKTRVPASTSADLPYSESTGRLWAAAIVEAYHRVSESVSVPRDFLVPTFTPRC